VWLPLSFSTRGSRGTLVSVAMARKRRRWFSAVQTLFGLALLVFGCASEPSSISVLEITEVDVATEPDDPLLGGNDAPPRYSLALRAANGASLPLESRVLAHVAFDGGVALIDSERRLIAVSGDGARRVLAEEAGAPPARGSRGELIYVAVKDFDAEVRVLERGGADRVIGSGLASAGMLAPRADGTVFFVGAKHGGVAGLWRIDDGTTRCLTNCDLETGTAWGDRFVPPPGDAAAIEVVGERVEWHAHDGKRYRAALRGER
jgi:hypothetical protein